jgi:Lipocalin-like domain
MGVNPEPERRPAVRAEDLVATWRLRSWKNVGSDGSAVDALGENPVGYIFYNRDGFMSVEIMAARRAPYQVPDTFGGTAQERSEAISTYLSYSGPFEVLSDQEAVIHHIEVSSYPNWIGNAQVRFAKLDGDLLTLSTKPMTFHGVQRRAELVWERVGHD